MSVRTRHLFSLAMAAVAGVTYASRAGHWSDLAFYATAVAILAFVVVAATVWVEFAPDGAFRRPRRG